MRWMGTVISCLKLVCGFSSSTFLLLTFISRFLPDVHQFDAHEIPFDGPTGIITLVERLLVSAPNMGADGKRKLLDKFVRIILQQA